MTRHMCAYCGQSFNGPGYSPDDDQRYCCYGCYLVQRLVGARGENGFAASLLIRLGTGAFLAMNVMMLSLILYAQGESELGTSVVRGLRWALLVLSTPCVLVLGLPYLTGSIRGLRARKVGMDLLILTGSVAAYCVSAAHVTRGEGPVYFDTATMLLLIVTLGKLLEASAKSTTSEAVREVMDLIPQTAVVLREGVEQLVPSPEVRSGDVLVVRPGERIAADGELVRGECLIQQAEFTGESRPRHAVVGDAVFGGSLNCDGLVHVQATSVGTDALLARMQHMVRSAQERRAPIERLAERAASGFVPAVWLVSIAALAYWGIVRGDMARGWLSALAVLVVACPCALGLATPLATCLAIGRAARAGVLIGSGEVLERLACVRRVFFDKTGTLTDSRLAVSGIRIMDGATDPNYALSLAASLESASEHSVASAVVSEASARGIAVVSPTEFHAIPGRGVEGVVGAVSVTAGSLQLLGVRHALPDGVRDDSDYPSVYVGWGGQVRAEIIMTDRARDDAGPAVELLMGSGIGLAVLSGDRYAPTSRLARDLGIGDVFAECTPDGKAQIVAKAGRGVAMVGDGINDAPALAAADVGIAVGSGTDLAREASDVTLIGDDLSRIPWVLDLSRATFCTIRQNLWWAFGYNSAAITLAFFGYVHPLIAASAMIASSLFVMGNSVRCRR